MMTMKFIPRTRTLPSLTLSLLLIACSLFSATVGNAALSLPGHVYQMEDIDEAIDEAKGWAQPIAFVYTDLDCGCSLAESATYDAFRVLRSDMTIVYACSKNEWSTLPAVVKKALKTAESGRYIPKTVIVSTDMTRVLAIVPYIRNPDERLLVLEETIGIAAEND